MTALLPNAKQSFFDNNGNPLAGGQVFFYIPNTSTLKNTYQDKEQTILNTNPVILDSRGEAVIWGNGTYRQVVKDADGNLIWDRITEDPNAGLTGNMIDKLFVSGTDFTPGVTTQLTLPVGPGSIANTWMFFDTAYQADDQIDNLNGTTLTLKNPIPVGVQVVTVKIGSTIAIGTPSAGTVTDESVAANAAIQSTKLSYRFQGTGGVTRTAYSKFSDWISAKDFGAKCDWNGTTGTDDTAAIQAAINYSLSLPKALPIGFPGQSLITASLKIDRLVDTTTSEFMLFGMGPGAGLFANTNITMFDSNLPMPTVDPQSESVTFKDMNFEGTLASNVYVLTKKFLRMKFENCYFLRLRFITSDTYLQSFYFHYCNVRFWPGTWIIASHCFDTHFDQCQSEFGAGYLTNFANGSYGLTFSDGLHEGSGGGLVSGGGFRQMKIDGYYLEQNALPDVAMNAGATNWDVSITNSIFASTPTNVANPSYYNIVWGPTVGAYGGGNYHTNGRLHDNSGLNVGGLLRNAGGDQAAITVFRAPLSADGVTTDVASLVTSTLGTGACNWARATRQGKLLFLEVSFTFSGASGSVAALNLPLPGVSTVFGGFSYLTDYVATDLVPSGGAGHPAVLSPSLLAMCQNKAGLGITYTNLSGKTVDFSLTYQVQS